MAAAKETEPSASKEDDVTIDGAKEVVSDGEGSDNDELVTPTTAAKEAQRKALEQQVRQHDGYFEEENLDAKEMLKATDTLLEENASMINQIRLMRRNSDAGAHGDMEEFRRKHIRGNHKKTER